MKATILALLVAGMLGAGGECRAQAAAGNDNGAGPAPFGAPAMLALGNAACVGDIDAMRRSLADGAVVDGAGEAGITPLLWALRCRSLEGVNFLLDAGADPNRVINDIPTVIFASRLEDVRFLATFLAHGANPNASYRALWSSPLNAALLHGSSGRGWAHWDLLLRSGADVNMPDHRGQTTATNAANLNEYEKVIELIDHGYTYDLPALRRIVTSSIAIAGGANDPARLRLVAILDERLGPSSASPTP